MSVTIEAGSFGDESYISWPSDIDGIVHEADVEGIEGGSDRNGKHEFYFPHTYSAHLKTERIVRKVREFDRDEEIDVLFSPHTPETEAIGALIERAGAHVHFLGEEGETPNISAHKHGAAVLKVLPRRFRHAA